MNHFRAIAFVICITAFGFVQADDAIVAKYLANAGVLITQGETKIVFDPLFDNNYDFYELVPKDIEQALFDGRPPFDGVDAIFVSHHHGDHFSPVRMAQLLQAHPDLQLFGPSQAIDAMPVDKTDPDLRNRMHSVSLDMDSQFSMVVGDIEVSAIRIRHSGWPDRHAEIDNIAFRVSLDDKATVLHMGDAHTDPKMFDRRADYWAERHMHLAMPPYWYFMSSGGKKILEDHVRADVTVGVHVPANIPDTPSLYPDELRGRLLFSVPGEEKRIPVAPDAK
jgi:L-ascorbate metabolism protein UlaG (beta-lactamase superfamily)